MAEKFDPLTYEPEILRFWEENNIHKKAKDKNKGNEDFYFLDGPPYTSGKVHLGTAWNKSLKDSLLRFKRMKGLNVWDRAGYDMHGLPTEQGVEKKLGIKFKEEIPKFGVAKFVKACEDFAVSNLKIMNKDFQRLGVWMDFENAYQTRKNEWIEGEWWLIKKAHENNRLYEGEKTMHWCGRCGTSLSKHELEYKQISDNSIFVKFPIKGHEKEFLIIWTTTPWTIPFNLGIMVNPKLDYVKAKVDDEIWIVAKALAAPLIQSVVDKELNIIDEMKGKKLEGMKYSHPFSDQIKQYKDLEEKHPKVHSVVMSEEYVDTSAGSGLVHMAPGCGPEDYEVGHENNIPPFNTLSESGVFEDLGEFTGLKAKKDDIKFIEALEKREALVAKTKVEHDYAHCWRCKEPIIYKTTTQWFFKIEDLKDDMRKLNKNINWVPYSAGAKNYDNWLLGLRDNGITRQRYWGTPLPVWKCSSCGKYDVIGSVEELKSLAVNQVPEDLHKPWIDEVKLKCACGKTKDKVPDVLDVWIDAGSASWNCLYYPKRKDFFDKLYPADFILEGIDQIRGWFNLLFVASMVAMKNNSFKSVYMHGFINDASGRKMSKSLGNYIIPEEVIAKYGADTFRFYAIGGTNAGEDLNYNFDDMKVKYKSLSVLWNMHNYVAEMAHLLGVNPTELKVNKEDQGIEEKYILSKLNSTIKKVTEHYEKYELDQVPAKVEELFLELSRTYIQLTREKASVGDYDDKKIVLYTIYNVLFETLKIFTPAAPFICEKIYLNLKKWYNLPEDSISFCSWPKGDENMIDTVLEEDMETVSSVIQSILSSRERLQKGVRWPLKQVVIVSENEEVVRAVENLSQIILKQTNVKEIDVKTKLDGVKSCVKGDYKKLGPEFGEIVPKIIAELSTNSAETILKHIEKEGKYVVKVGNEKYDIKKDHLLVERVVPEKYVEGSFRGGFSYVYKETTPELESEGYAREVMRRVQVLRKDAGLNKSDRINLFVRSEIGLSGYAEMIKEKVGADDLELSEKDPSKEYSSNSTEKIKGKEFFVGFDKV